MAVIATIFFSVLLASSASYILTKDYYQNILTQIHPLFVKTTEYKLLHPITGIALPGNLDSKLDNIRGGIQSIASTPLAAGTVTRYAVYLRDLNTGNWIGINENDQYDPASLLKVVVAIAAYRQVEDQPEYLSTPITYTPALAEINTQLPFAQPVELQVGQSYSVPFLVKAELSDSDNGAVYALLNSINDQELDKVYNDLSVPPPNDTNSVGYKITALEYSRFFRILYNGTLSLDWADSERILEDLSQATFTSGLVAGVPNTVTVAHKYGEHVDGANGVATSVELSDCGIVYTPQPYFLCVMTQGNDPGTLANFIAQISKFVYQKIST